MVGSRRRTPEVLSDASTGAVLGRTWGLRSALDTGACGKDECNANFDNGPSSPSRYRESQAFRSQGLLSRAVRRRGGPAQQTGGATDLCPSPQCLPPPRPPTALPSTPRPLWRRRAWRRGRGQGEVGEVGACVSRSRTRGLLRRETCASHVCVSN